jgi:hypothetical protein
VTSESVTKRKTRAVWSPLGVRIRWPSWENAVCETISVWPSNLATSWPLAAFHTRAVRSQLAVTIRWLSGENAA